MKCHTVFYNNMHIHLMINDALRDGDILTRKNNEFCTNFNTFSKLLFKVLDFDTAVEKQLQIVLDNAS
jgi:hypothetical protein